MKLELKHIQHYPIGGENALRLQYRGNVAKLNGMIGTCCWISIGKDKFTTDIINIKPILRPMSDLYKERDGKIDIVELAKVACKICKVEFEPDFTTIKHNEGHSIVVRCKKWESEFWYHFDGYFYFEYNGDIMDFPQLDLFNYLFEHHFDVYGLIDKGLAIDINTLGK